MHYERREMHFRSGWTKSGRVDGKQLFHFIVYTGKEEVTAIVRYGKSVFFLEVVRPDLLLTSGYLEIWIYWVIVKQFCLLKQIRLHTKQVKKEQNQDSMSQSKGVLSLDVD